MPLQERRCFHDITPLFPVIKLCAGPTTAPDSVLVHNYLSMELQLTATECHLPYGITQWNLLPDTSEHTPP